MKLGMQILDVFVSSQGNRIFSSDDAVHVLEAVCRTLVTWFCNFRELDTVFVHVEDILVTKSKPLYNRPVLDVCSKLYKYRRDFKV